MLAFLCCYYSVNKVKVYDFVVTIQPPKEKFTILHEFRLCGVDRAFPVALDLR